MTLRPRSIWQPRAARLQDAVVAQASNLPFSNSTRDLLPPHGAAPETGEKFKEKTIQVSAKKSSHIYIKDETVKKSHLGSTQSPIWEAQMRSFCFWTSSRREVNYFQQDAAKSRKIIITEHFYQIFLGLPSTLFSSSAWNLIKCSSLDTNKTVSALIFRLTEFLFTLTWRKAFVATAK